MGRADCRGRENLEREIAIPIRYRGNWPSGVKTERFRCHVPVWKDVTGQGSLRARLEHSFIRARASRNRLRSRASIST